MSLARLSQNPEFNALSHMWGKQEATEAIVIEGQSFLIRQNLLVFLKRFRREGRPIPIWIDAIRVNQCDLPERTRQVRLMSKIYGQAKLVIVWLGEDPHGNLQVPDTEPAQTLLGQPLLSGKAVGAYEFIVKVLDAVIHFMSNLYWIRTWIVQELLLAQHVQVYYGLKGILSLESVYAWRANVIKLVNFMGSADQMYQQSLDIVDPRSSSNKILDCKYPSREGDWFQGELRSRQAANLIAHFIDTQCTDPRDKIHTFLGLAQDRDSHGVVADYTKSAVDLFVELCNAHTYSWLGRRLALAKCLQGALECTYDVLTLTSSCRCGLESGVADCVVVKKELPKFREQPFSNVIVDEQSLHAAIVLKAHILGNKIDLEALRVSRSLAYMVIC